MTTRTLAALPPSVDFYTSPSLAVVCHCRIIYFRYRPSSTSLRLMKNSVDAMTAALHILEESWWGAAAHRDGCGDVSVFSGGKKKSKTGVINDAVVKNKRATTGQSGEMRFPAPGLALHPSSLLSLSPSAGPLVARSTHESAQRVCAFVCVWVFMRARMYVCRDIRERERQGRGWGALTMLWRFVWVSNNKLLCRQKQKKEHGINRGSCLFRHRSPFTGLTSCGLAFTVLWQNHEERRAIVCWTVPRAASLHRHLQHYHENERSLLFFCAALIENMTYLSMCP